MKRICPSRIAAIRRIASRQLGGDVLVLDPSSEFFRYFRAPSSSAGAAGPRK